MVIMAAAPAHLDRARIAALTACEEKRPNEATPQSGAMYGRARRSMTNGMASSCRVREPWPIYRAEGKGARGWDVDGREMVDIPNGTGRVARAQTPEECNRDVAVFAAMARDLVA